MNSYCAESVDVFNLPEGIVVFGKSICPNCDKVKAFLTGLNLSHVVVSCDEFLRDDRDRFLRTMKGLTGGVVPKVFPMVFVDRRFVGGYLQTLKHFEDDDW